MSDLEPDRRHSRYHPYRGSRQERGDLRGQHRPPPKSLERELLDGIVVHLVPVLLGEEVRFYEATSAS